MNKQTKDSKKITIPVIAALLLSVKNTFIEHQARLFPFARAFFGFCLTGLLLVSCASGPGPKRAGNIWDAWNPNTESGRLTRFGVSTIDGQDIQTYWFSGTARSPYEYGYNIPHGQHEVNVSAIWSNGFEDSTQLTLDVKEGKKYAVYAYEIQEGQDPNAPTVLTKDYKEHGGGKIGAFFKENAGSFLFVAGISYPPLGLAILTVGAIAGTIQENRSKHGSQPNETNPDSKDTSTNTEAQPTDSVAETVAQPPTPTSDTETKPEETVIAKVSQIVKPPPAPTARPFDGCCYVWIEDSDTREVVAGKKLPGAGIDGH